MDLSAVIREEFVESRQTLENFLSDNQALKQIASAGQILADCIKNGGKIISCGNGGSHCDAMHFAEELTGRYRENRRSLPAIAISDPSHISCVANDFGYEYVFSRFVEGLGKAEDVLLGISTSGNSINVVNAVKSANAIGMKSVVLTGNDGGLLADLANLEIRVPYNGHADRIQEVHIKIIHALILSIELLTVDN